MEKKLYESQLRLLAVMWEKTSLVLNYLGAWALRPRRWASLLTVRKIRHSIGFIP